MKMNTCSESSYMFGGLTLYSGTDVGVVRCCEQWILRQERKYICVTSLHGLTESVCSADVAEAYRHAGLSVPDGMPLVWIGRMLGHSQTTRIYGPDLMLSLCSRAEKMNIPIFLFGTTEDTLRRLKRALYRLFPDIVIVGAHSPPFRPLTTTEERNIVEMINSSRARIVFVGLSTPKQELLMHRFVPKIHANVTIGVGAAFDFIAGTKKQAPVRMRQIGAEWIFRLIQEPKRLGRRYATSFVIGIRMVFAQLFRAIIPKQ